MTSYSGSAAGATAVDLSRLPFPHVIEPLDFTQIVAARKAELLGLAPELEPVLSVPAEPLVKFIEACAYRELNLRARINDAAEALTLAKARGADLDHLVALLGVARLELTPADPEAGTPAVMEDDEALRSRALLAPDSYSVAGPAAAYVYHALSAHGGILDASAHSPNPGEVVVTVLGRESGALDPGILAAAEAAVTNPDVRPLTDLVLVQAAEVIGYQVKAELTYWSGPDAQVARAEALDRVSAYAEAQRRLGRGVARSGLIAALHPEGVRNVDLIEPPADVPAAIHQAAVVRAIRLDGALLPETQTALAAMTTAPDAARAALYDDLIAALVTADVWEKLDLFFVLAAHHEQAARVNLKQPGFGNLTAVNSPTFTSDAGFKGDGVAAHMAAGVTLAELGAYGLADAAMFVWPVTEDAPGTDRDMGTADEQVSAIVSRSSSGNYSARTNTTANSFNIGVDTAKALRAWVRAGSEVRAYSDDTLLDSATAEPEAVGIGAVTVLRSGTSHTARRLAAAGCGGSLTSPQIAALHAALHTYLTAVGALS